MNKADTQKQEKPVVPRYVAEFFEAIKDDDDFEYRVYELCTEVYKGKLPITNYEFYKWFTDNNNKPIQTLVDMSDYGYEVEDGIITFLKMMNRIESKKNQKKNDE